MPLQALAPAIIVIAAAAIAVVPAGTFYLTNDDVAMRLLAEGRFATGAGPTPFLLFMNVILGALLATLYRVTDVVPWYDLVMVTITLVACVALVRVWTAPRTVTAYLAALLLAVFFFMPLFATPKFSLTGMTATAAGLTLLARPLTVPLDDESRRRHLIAGSLLVILGALVRWEATVNLLCQAVPSVIVTRLPAMRRRGMAAVWPVARAAAIVTALVGVTIAMHFAAYAVTPGWREFPRFNLARASLTEYATNVPLTPALVSAVGARTGWSANDFTMLQSWFFVDPTLFTLERLQAAQAVYAEHATPRSAALDTVATWVRDLLFTTNAPAMFVLAAVALARPRPLRHLVTLACLIGVLYLVLLVVMLNLKAPPFHVHWPMLVLVAGLLPLDDVDSRSRARQVAPILVLLGVAIYVLPGTIRDRWREQDQRQARTDVLAAEVDQLRRSGATFAGLHASTMRWELFWRPFRRPDFGMAYAAFAASAQTPPIRQALARRRAVDFVQGLCTHDRWVLVADRQVLPTLTTFMAEHHQQRVAFDRVIEGRELAAWRCRVE